MTAPAPAPFAPGDRVQVLACHDDGEQWAPATVVAVDLPRYPHAVGVKVDPEAGFDFPAAAPFDLVVPAGAASSRLVRGEQPPALRAVS